MEHIHTYKIHTHWKPADGQGNADVKKYDRTHAIEMEGKPTLRLTTDNVHVGNPALHNPEDLLLTSLSSCHMLSYLYVCALEGIVVLRYEDQAVGRMRAHSSGGGAFEEVVLKPFCTLANASMLDRARALHREAHRICYIANSVNFPVLCEPEFDIIQEADQD